MKVPSYPKCGPWNFSEEMNVFVNNKLNQERMMWIIKKWSFCNTLAYTHFFCKEVLLIKVIHIHTEILGTKAMCVINTWDKKILNKSHFSKHSI